MQRTKQVWKKLPGNMDTLNMNTIFYSDNEFGIPTIDKDLFVPEWVIPAKQRIQSDRDVSNGAIHFFVDDYHFETMWNRTNQTLSIMQRIGRAFSPDFSIYTEYPVAAQIWNTYRNRWLGRYWQMNGISVIPTITWGDERSYDFCYLGVPKGSNVAISTVGANMDKDKEAQRLFVKGFEEMLKRIEPNKVLVYGEVSPIKLEDYCDVKWYPSYWKTLRDVVAQKKKATPEE